MFYLSSEDLGKPNIENIIYEINGNIPLIKNICCSKIAKSFKMIKFDINQIKQLKIFVSKDKDNNYTETEKPCIQRQCTDTELKAP